MFAFGGSSLVPVHPHQVGFVWGWYVKITIGFAFKKREVSGWQLFLSQDSRHWVSQGSLGAKGKKDKMFGKPALGPECGCSNALQIACRELPKVKQPKRATDRLLWLARCLNRMGLERQGTSSPHLMSEEASQLVPCE